MKTERKILLKDVNQFIMCEICKGYLIDATTITECLHTFCKKCIVQYLEENTNCPKCDILLHQSHPLLYVAHDRTLQSIVYKLVANLERDELERQIKYYDENELEYPPPLREKLEQFNLAGRQHGKTSSVCQAESSATPSSAGNSNESKPASITNKQAPESTPDRRDPTDFHRIDEPITISLEPLEGLKNLDKKYILCSCHATITHLKKMVAANIFGDLELYKELDIVCEDEILGKDHTLKFIRVTKWKDKVTQVTANYFGLDRF